MSRSQAQPPSTGIAPLIGLVTVGAVLALMQLYMVIPLFGEIRARYHVSPAAGAWAGTMFSLTLALGSLAFARLQDRVDRRRMMAIGLTGAAIGAGICAAASGYSQLLVGRGVSGFFCAAFPPAGLAYLAEILPLRDRTLGLSVVSTGLLLAGILGQAYSLLVFRLGGLAPVFWITGPLLVLVAAVLLRLPRSSSPEPPAGRGDIAGDDPEGFREFLRRPGVVAAYWTALTLLCSFVAMYAGLTTELRENFGVEGTVSQLLMRLPGLPGILLGVLAGSAFRRFGVPRTGAVALAVAAGGLVLESISGTVPMLAASSAVFMLGLGLAVPSGVAAISQSATAGVRGAALAIYAFLVGLGASLGPLLATNLHQAGFGVLCAVLAVLLISGSATLGLSSRPRVPVPVT